MAQGDTPITVVGNLVNQPELRFTQSGTAVANFRIASTPRVYNRNTQQYEDGEPLFLGCTVWKQLAENVATSLQKGMRVIVQGNLKQRSYQTQQGEQRQSYEIDVQEVGPSLRFATANVERAQQGGGAQQPQQQGGFGGQQSPQGGFGQQQTQQAQQSQDAWSQAPAGFGGDEEPPF